MRKALIAIVLMGAISCSKKQEVVSTKQNGTMVYRVIQYDQDGKENISRIVQ